jgi:4,5-DOPA dioxygenase extradiol
MNASTAARAPSLFVSHGAPTLAIEPGIIGPKLSALGESLHDVRAWVIVSPHWMTRGLQVMAAEQPATVHDFGGFPAELYTLQYPAPGSAALAQRVLALLQAAGLPATANPQHGRDHGAWVPMRYLRPQADQPALQVSLPHDATPASAYTLGRALEPLRDEGVAVLGSGSLTHNLAEWRGGAAPAAYATAFAQWAETVLTSGDEAALLDYRRRAPHAERAHPTDEHLLPLMMAAGAAGAQFTDASQRAVQRIDGGIQDGVLSMDAYRFG